MRTALILFCLGIPALGLATVRPGHNVGRPDTSLPAQGIAAEWALPKNAFREFLLESRRREDSLQYRLGESALRQDEFVLALGHHLAVSVPEEGRFRNDLLAQRSRIFARLWPLAEVSAPERETDADKGAAALRPVYDWGAGAEHTRWMDRMGPGPFPGMDGFREENRDWTYRTYVRRNWLVPFVGKAFHLGVSANALRSSHGAASGFEAALEAEAPEGMFQGLFLSLSSGLDRARGWGSHRYHRMSASRAWYDDDAGLGLEAGCSARWDGGWKRTEAYAWAKADRGLPFPGGNGLGVSLEASAAGFDLFTLSPSVRYGMDLPAGLDALARAGYALDLYPGQAGGGEYPESEPLERDGSIRLDNRLGLKFGLRMDSPRGYSASLESSGELGWTNQAGSPVAYRPWQWGMALNVSRSVFR